jgi:hypothetical protein
MLSKISKISFVALSAIAPIFVGAEVLGGTVSILSGISGIVTAILIPLAFSLALLYFFYGVAKYVWSEGTGKAEGKQIMIWGVVALFVMSSVWGLVAFIRGELQIGPGSDMPIPSISR